MNSFTLKVFFFFFVFNPFFTKPFGTHTFYQGWGRPDPSDISKTVAPMNMKFCGVLETPLKVLEILKLSHSVYLVTIATPQRRGVLGENR